MVHGRIYIYMEYRYMRCTVDNSTVNQCLLVAVLHPSNMKGHIRMATDLCQCALMVTL